MHIAGPAKSTGKVNMGQMSLEFRDGRVHLTVDAQPGEPAALDTTAVETRTPDPEAGKTAAASADSAARAAAELAASMPSPDN
jgi:hypothetical protein